MSKLFPGSSNPYTGGLMGGIDQLQNYGSAFRGLAGQAGSMYGQYQPQYNQALQGYAGLLGRNATDSDKAAYTNQQLGQVQNNFLGGQAGLMQNLAQRGISPDSSVNAGGQAVLEGQRDAALGQAGQNASPRS